MRLIVNVDVPELGPALTFYQNALGLKLNRFLDDDVAELTGASSVIYLLRNPSDTAATAGDADISDDVRNYGRHWTPVHLDFVVDDLAAAAARAVDAGAEQESECVDWRGSHCITFADPFGNGFCLIAFDRTTYS